MRNLSDCIVGMSVEDARDSFYYLCRFLKQASFSDDYKKDIFDDASGVMPSNKVKSTTIEMLSVIEEAEQKKASDFTNDEFIKWVSEINRLDASLDPEPSEALKIKAKSIASDFSVNLKSGKV